MAESSQELKKMEDSKPAAARRTRVAVYIPRADVIERADSFLVLAILTLKIPRSARIAESRRHIPVTHD